MRQGFLRMEGILLKGMIQVRDTIPRRVASMILPEIPVNKADSRCAAINIDIVLRDQKPIDTC